MSSARPETPGEIPKTSDRLNSKEIQLSHEIIRRFIRGFSSGLCIHTGYTLITSLFKNSLKTSLGKAWKTVWSRQCLQTAAFFGFFPSLYRLLIAVLNTLRKTEDGWNYGIAGALAGLSIKCLDDNRRQTFTFFCLSRALGAGLSTLVARGDLPFVPNTDVLVFAACCGIILYSTCLHPEYMSPGYYYSVLKWARDYSDATATHVFRTPNTKFLNCQEAGVHEGSCVKHFLWDVMTAFPVFAKIYLPIHAIPVLFYKRESMRKSPVPVLLSFIKNLVSSTNFLVTMVAVAKLGLCLIRSCENRPPPLNAFIPLVSGFIGGGLGLFWERKSRRKELTLFTLFQTLSILHTAFRKSSLPLSGVVIPHGFTLVFVMSMMIVMHAYEKRPDALSSTVKSVLKFFVGERNSTSKKEKQKNS